MKGWLQTRQNGGICSPVFVHMLTLSLIAGYQSYPRSGVHMHAYWLLDSRNLLWCFKWPNAHTFSFPWWHILIIGKSEVNTTEQLGHQGKWMSTPERNWVDFHNSKNCKEKCRLLKRNPAQWKNDLCQSKNKKKKWWGAENWVGGAPKAGKRKKKKWMARQGAFTLVFK